MRKIISYVDNDINRIREEIKSNEDHRIKYEKVLTLIKLYESNLDSINKEQLDQFLDDQTKSSVEYDDAIFFIGDYNENGNESQIIKSRDYLNNLLKQIQTNIEDSIKKCSDNLKYQELIDKDKTLKEFLENYTSETYVNKEMLEDLFALVSKEDVDEEIRDIFVTIGKNNYEIAKKKQVSQEKTIKSTSEEIKAKRIRPKQASKEELETKKKIYISMYKNFLTNEKLKEKYPDMYDKIEYISRNLDQTLEDMSDEKFEEILDFIEEDVVLSGTVAAMVLVKNIVKNKTKIAQSILNDYMHSDDFDLKGYFHLIGREDVAEALERSEQYYDPEYEKSSSYKKIQSILSEITGNDNAQDNKDSKTYLEDMKITSRDLNIYRMHEAIVELELAREEDMEQQYIDEHLATLENSLDLIEGKIKIQDPLETTTDINTPIIDDETEEEDTMNLPDNLYDGSFRNYVVLLDKETIDKDFSNLCKDKYEVNERNLCDKLRKLVMIEPEQLQNDAVTRNIKISKGVSNPYEVLELRNGAIRVGFKRLENAEIDGHPVYVVMTASYGNCGKNEKGQELLKNIKLFEKNQQQYNKLMEICSKENNQGEINPEVQAYIDESAELYKKFYDKQKKKNERRRSK